MMPMVRPVGRVPDTNRCRLGQDSLDCGTGVEIATACKIANMNKELRSLTVQLPPVAEKRTVRFAEIRVVLADGTTVDDKLELSTMKTGATMDPWPVKDLLDVVRQYVEGLQNK
jgi:hypothetical protein